MKDFYFPLQNRSVEFEFNGSCLSRKIDPGVGYYKENFPTYINETFNYYFTYKFKIYDFFALDWRNKLEISSEQKVIANYKYINYT